MSAESLLAPSRDSHSSQKPSRTDGEFLEQLAFADAAPRGLTKAAEAGDVSRFAMELCHSGIPQPRKLSASPSREAQAAWLFPAGETSALDLLTRETLQAFDAKSKRALQTEHVAALVDAIDSHADVEPAHVAACLTLLPRAAKRLPPETVFALWRRVVEAATACVPANGVEGIVDDPTLAPEVQLLLAGEIPYRMGCVLPCLASAEDWRRVGRRELRRALATHVDDAGIPRSELLTCLPQFLACLTRAASDSDAFDAPLWKSHDADLLRGLTQFTTALSDGRRFAGVDRVDASTMCTIVETLARGAGWKKSSAPRRLLAVTSEVAQTSGSQRDRRGEASKSEKWTAKPRPAVQSDESQVALLRSDWSPEAHLLLLVHDRPAPALSFSAAGSKYLTGAWRLEATRDGEPIPIEGKWNCECWHSDKDADFIELGRPLPDGLLAVRQAFLSRRDQFLLLVDSVRGAGPEVRIGCRATLDLAPGIDSEADAWSRELQLLDGDRRCRLFPITQPLERVRSSDGGLRVEDRHLVYESHGAGGVCQALFLDWSARRARKSADWSPLTVAENGRILAPREAAAARVRVGSNQWAYLHNLTPAETPRTVLGHHTTSESVIGQFSSKGDLELLVHVEGENA